MSYQSPKYPELIERRVDPYGLALRRGVWTLVGYCHLRQGLRTFHVHRIRQLKMNTAKPRTPDFEVPQDFSLDAHVAHYPWQHRFHPPVDVELELRGELAARAESLLPGAPVTREAGVARVRVPTTYTDGLLRFCLALGPGCRVLSPEPARARLREMAERVLQRHADGGGAAGEVRS